MVLNIRKKDFRSLFPFPKQNLKDKAKQKKLSLSGSMRQIYSVSKHV